MTTEGQGRSPVTAAPNKFAKGLSRLRQEEEAPPTSPPRQPDRPSGEAKPGTRAGKRALTFYLDQAAYKQFAILAVEEDRNHEALLREALNLLFQNRGRSPIA
jgi:hypothetical protein